jgi:E3 ubiquitin-protein ligase listerin
MLSWSLELFNIAWDVLSSSIKTQVIASQNGVPALVPAVLRGFRASALPESKLKLSNDQLITDVVYSTMLRFEEILDQDESTAVDQVRLTSLVTILDTFGDDIFTDKGLASVSIYHAL